MRDWRELGEVPDSDDDSNYDSESQDDQHDQLEVELDHVLPETNPDESLESLETRTEDVHTKPAEDADIWSFPSSSPKSQPSQKLTKTPSPVPSIPEIHDLERLSPGAENVFDSPATPSTKPASTTENAFLEDEISTGYVRAMTPGSPASSLASILSRTPSPPISPSLPWSRSTPLPQRRPSPLPQRRSSPLPQRRSSPLPDRGTLPDDQEELSRQTAIQLERSLRPRKPIQEHPYLLENAHYTTFMKSHGVKPIRVAPQPQLVRSRAEEEDSQDQDFQAEESQEASAEGLMRGIEESGPMLFNDDEDELALTPSLPKTSPLGQHLRTSSQQTSADQTDATSLSDDDELPPLGKLWPVSAKQRSRTLKRQRSRQLSSTQRKRTRFVLPDSSSPPRPTFIPPPDIWNLSPSPPEPQTSHEPSQELGNAPRPPARERLTTPDESAKRPRSTTDHHTKGAEDSPIVIDEDNQSELSDADLTDSTHNSDSESDVVRNSRRMRGVLPASWLRLNQRPEKPAARNVRQRSQEPSPNRGARKGVALPRQGSQRPSSTAPFVLFNESDSDEASMPRGFAAEDSPQPLPPTIVIDLDDGASVVEEDSIDWMLPGRKRSASHSITRRAKKQKQSGTQVFKGQPGQSLRQPKITQALGRPKNGAASAAAKRTSTGQHRGERNLSEKRRSRKRATTPPLLSILDVVEPDAPRFIKIAARAVKKKANLGKTSPSKKLISLATRSDNVDALSVLRDWKSGKTKPRIAVPPSRMPNESEKPGKPRGRPALREISSNVSRPRPTHPQKLVRQSRLDAFVAVDNGEDPHSAESPSTAKPSARRPLQDRRPSFHPAQLEEVEGEDKRRQLTSRKRTLDAFYRRSRRMPDVSTDDGFDQPLDVDFTLRESVGQEQNSTIDIEEPPLTTRKKRVVQSKSRKQRRPQYVDPGAPQYARANDPLPAAFFVPEVQEHHPKDKLKGLGPYGSQYTHHFEVFPLHRGTFFHESTVIGRGWVRDAVDVGLLDRIRHPRPATSFSLDGKVLRWGAWDDNTSSELGILMDWVAEQLGSDAAAGEAMGEKAIAAADFVVGYILGSLSIRGSLEEKTFLSRWLDVFSSFSSRFESVEWTTLPESAKKTQLDVAARFFVAMLAVRSLSQAPEVDWRQTMKAEELLRDFASVTIGRLLKCGTEELHTLYGDLQQLSSRERGIRSDRVVANCWVVIIKVLEGAAIPRSSFWDVTHKVMLSNGVALDSDAQVFERLWQDTFTLLPLFEIDNNGILIPGMRLTSPVEGWALPQQLLKRVFQLYQANPRQPPGFNDYCRALVARCHFLVQEWGWRKCTGIIGTIFDFFGSQNLAHLRNEEANKSPRFLEELDHSPSRSIERIEPEDRCFHIFIKLLALAIRRLKELGRLNDIKNLVARTLPNHDRQHLKEDTVHQHDLAALRNHHDLLCTLFWASPPDMRPKAEFIQKLVVPADAHKEACLINVRAWNQLARFVICNGEGSTAFKPLAVWRNDVFHQVMDQYHSAASDIEQQFRALSGDMPGISKEVRDDMVAKNKATSLDVLHFSVKASLDVLQRAPTLEAALYALSITQLQKVFTSLDLYAPGFDWGVLLVALDTLEHFLGRIDQASEEQYSSEYDSADSGRLEEAVLLLNERLAKDFFWMSRTTLALPLEKSLGRYRQQATCAEKTVTLAARIAARFVKNRITQLSPYFSTGKHGLFTDLPKNLITPERKYLPLFLAVLVKNHIFDFKDLGMSILGLWMLSIAKPLRHLKYENHLAEVLQHHNLPFLTRATVTVGIPPDYNSNIDFFACAIHHMRKTLRESPSAQSRQHREEFSKILQLAMRKIKADLALLRPHPAEHARYIDFVRQLISLIKSHGVGITVVDAFFTQPSADYSPPLQDPQLHTAGIVAYGVRLSERDPTAVPQLFHYLFNNFKIALGNDRLGQECRILGEAMGGSAHVASFVLRYMLPAVVQAVVQVPECWVLLEVYVVALDGVLGGGCVPRDLGEEDMELAAGVLSGILAWFEGVRGVVGVVSLTQLHVMMLLVAVANVLRLSVTSYLVNEPDGVVPGLGDVVDRLSEVVAEVKEQLAEVLCRPDGELSEASIGVATLMGRVPRVESTGGRDARVQDFAKTIVSDVRRNWVVSEGSVMVKMASGRGASGGIPTMTQAASSLQGVKYTPWDVRGVLQGLFAEVEKWESGAGVVERKGTRRGRGAGLGEELLF